MRSAKELSLDKKIIEALESFDAGGKALAAGKLVLEDEETQAVQEYANNVSIVRLGYNDHGPVHMRQVLLNALKMAELLSNAGIKTSLEQEEFGNFDDSLAAIVMAAMLHDLGMSIGRHDHELHSANLALPIIDRILRTVYSGEIKRFVSVRSLALEGILGHMGGRTINSLEAGIIQASDGCDMKKGRAKISIAIHPMPRAGNIHQYSANSIEEVTIGKGSEKPIRIDVLMSSEVGLFQVEEVLLAKISSGTAKPYIELYTQVQDKAPMRYL